MSLRTSSLCSFLHSSVWIRPFWSFFPFIFSQLKHFQTLTHDRTILSRTENIDRVEVLCVRSQSFCMKWRKHIVPARATFNEHLTEWCNNTLYTIYIFVYNTFYNSNFTEQTSKELLNVLFCQTLCRLCWLIPVIIVWCM